MIGWRRIVGCGVLWVLMVAGRGAAQDTAGMQKTLEGLVERVQTLEDANQNLAQRVRAAESEASQAAGYGTEVFLVGVFCALWAQNTRRNAWLWFFAGVIFNVVALLVLLHKNAYGPRASQHGLRVGST